MYIGPWQEYRLSVAVGGPKRRKPRLPTIAKAGDAVVRNYKMGTSQGYESSGEERDESARSWSATPRSLSSCSVVSEGTNSIGGTSSAVLDRVKPESIEQLVHALKSRADGEQQKEVLKLFLEQQLHLQQKISQPQSSVSSSLQQSLSNFVDLDPNRTKMLQEKNKERKLVQMRRERVPLKIVQLERRRADFEQHLAQNKSGGPNSNEGKSQFVQPSAFDASNQEDTCQEQPAPASILPTRPALLFNSFLPKTDQSIVRSVKQEQRPQKREEVRLEKRQEQFVAEQTQRDFRRNKMGSAGPSFSSLGIPCIGGPQSYKTENAGIPHQELGFPLLGGTNSPEFALSSSVSGKASTARYFGQEPTGINSFSPDTPLIGNGGIEGTWEPEQIMCNHPKSTYTNLPDRSSIPTPSLADTDVDDLVNWSQGLGMGKGDDFLFDESDNF